MGGIFRHNKYISIAIVCFGYLLEWDCDDMRRWAIYCVGTKLLISSKTGGSLCFDYVVGNVL